MKTNPQEKKTLHDLTASSVETVSPAGQQPTSEPAKDPDATQ